MSLKGDSNKYLVRAAVNAATMEGVKTVSAETAAKVAEFLYRSNSIWSALSVYSTMTSSILEEPWLGKFLVNLLLYVPKGSEKAIELLSVAVENKFHVSLGTLVNMHYIWSEMLKKQCGAKENGLPSQMSSSLSSSLSSTSVPVSLTPEKLLKLEERLGGSTLKPQKLQFHTKSISSPSIHEDDQLNSSMTSTSSNTWTSNFKRHHHSGDQRRLKYIHPTSTSGYMEDHLLQKKHKLTKDFCIKI
jgi:hypothetical protein